LEQTGGYEGSLNVRYCWKNQQCYEVHSQIKSTCAACYSHSPL